MSFRRYIYPPVKYHGLLNQGATCYLNSVLQVLFMTEDFRAAVERDTNENHDTECIDRHLANLFAELREREAYTYKITKKLGIIRVYEQQDAAEYFEKILTLTRSGASRIFQGLLTHKTICSGCGTEADSDAAFWHLPLALVDSNSDYSVVDGVEDYFRCSEFSGENQIYCDQCDDKSDATIKCVIKHHPEVLMLLLKRFEFNYSYMTYVKINRTVEVPFTLQIPENQTYELYAVVDHFGDLRGGHYTATIKDDEGWYTFNDSTVTSNNYQPFQVDNFEKSSSAYLLFYRKMNGPAVDTQDNMAVSAPEVILPATTQDGKREKMRMREEDEEAEEEGNVSMVAEMKDIAGSREVRLSPDLCDTEENQDTKSYNESNEETNTYQDVSATKQRDEEGVGGNTQAGEQTGQEEIERVERVEVQDSDSGKQTPEAEVSDRHEVHDPGRAVEYLDNEDNAREDVGGTQEVGEDDDVKLVSVQVKGKTGDDKRSSEGEKLFEFQDNRRDGDREENMQQQDYQMCKQGSSTSVPMYDIHEQQREDKLYVEEHKGGDDKHGQDGEDQAGSAENRRRTEDQRVGDDEKTRQHAPQVRPAYTEVADIDKRRGSKKAKVQNNEEDIRQNQPEQKISLDVGVKRQTEEKGNTGDELIPDKESPPRRAGSAGSRRGEKEDQRAGDDEETRQRQQHAPQVRPAYTEVADIDKRRVSKKSKVFHAKIIDEEIKETPSGTQRSIVTELIQIETVHKSSQENTLSKKFDNLNLTVSSTPEPKKRSTKRAFGKAQEGNETISATHSNYRKRDKVSDTQEQAAGMTDTEITRGSGEKKEGNIQPHKKRKKENGCFLSIFSCQRKEGKTSESD